MKRIISIYILGICVVLASCKNDEYDGLLNIDPMPENAVVFPASEVNGVPLMDDNAFIINQTSLANGNVVVKIKSASNKQIKSIEAKAQRFRGVIAWPNVSPTVPSAAAQRAPAAFSRTATTNLTKIEITPSSEYDYTIPLAALPASLTNATLGAVAAPAGATPNYDVFRFFFLVTYTDDTTILSNEVRVIVKG
jgi:hypothetical protein